MSKLRDKMLARQREMEEAAAFGPLDPALGHSPSLAGPEPKPAPKEPLKGRLPNGSMFGATYYADKRMWTGLLRVPRQPMGLDEFETSAPSIKKLLFALDDMYRAYLKEQEAAK